jgi:hypothetical protein
MPRTAIAITQLSAYLAGNNLTATAGDSANDHTLAADRPVTLICVNTNAATVDFTVELPAAKSTWNATKSISHTIPAAVGAVPGVRAIDFNVPGDVAQSGNVFHIDSADANFGDVRFYAVYGVVTPR